MAVGASKPNVVARGDGFFSVKNKMLVNLESLELFKHESEIFTYRLVYLPLFFSLHLAPALTLA